MKPLPAIIVTILLAGALSSAAQEFTDRPAERPAEDVVREETKEVTEKAPAEAERKKVSEKKPEKPAEKPERRETPVKRKTVAERETGEKRDDRLMEVEDSRVKLGRIPGLDLPERQASRITSVDRGLKEDALLQGEEIPDKESGDEKEKGGLFGLSKTVTDILARLALVGLILLIIILYRVRSQSRRKVFSPSRSSRKYKP